jgi:uncharacterized protein (TIGR02301 family)
MKLAARGLAGALCAMLATAAAGAPPPPQQPAKPAPAATPAPTPAPAPVETPPPYEPQLLRLSELMGALYYLRDLCHAGDGAEFRDKMAGLLEAEAHGEARKATLAGAFNKGLRDYALTYRTCNGTAQDVIARFLDESGRIARDIAGRYGG